MRRKSKILTEAEAEIMAVLWKSKQSSVQEVCQKLESRVAYTTVATMLRVLENKGYVSHKIDKRTYIYFPICDQNQERANVIDYITESFFGGSIKSLIAHLVQGDKLSQNQLQELKDIIDKDEEAES